MRAPRTVTGAILAGGFARRFRGLDKAGLIVDGRTILERQLEALNHVASEIIVVARDPTRYRDLGVRVVVDLVAGAGPLGGIYTALVSAATPHAIVLACDMPCVSAPLLALVADAGRDVDCALPRSHDGVHPLCASYATRIAPVLRQRIDEGRLKVTDALAGLDIVEIDAARVAAIDPTGVALANVNTEADYRRVLAVGRCGGRPESR